MSADLKLQVREYTEHFVSTVEPVQLDEIVSRSFADTRVRPVRSDTASNLGWAIAAAVVVATVVIVGGLLLLLQPADVPPVATTGVPTTTSGAPTTTTTTTSTLPPQPGSALEAVSNAFGGIYDVEFDRFYEYLGPDCELFYSATGETVGCLDPAIFELLAPVDIDFDADGIISHVDLFVQGAHHLALRPIEIEGCAPEGDIDRCLVVDTAVFHRALGVEPDPIPVVVRDQRIIRIEVGSSDGVPNAPLTLGGCSTCTGDPDVPIKVWEAAVDEYLRFIGVDPGGFVSHDETPLWIGWGLGGQFDDGFGELGWINDDALLQHRQLVADWLAERDAGRYEELRTLVNDYITAMAALEAHPEPQFDTAQLGSEQTLTGVASEGIGEAPSRPWLVSVFPASSSAVASYAIEVDQLADFYLPGITLDYEDRLPEGVVELGGLINGFVDIGPASPDFHALLGGLPTEASVVAVELSDGTQVWQRPFKGVAFVNVGRDTAVTMRVLDAQGQLLLEADLVRGEPARLVTPN